MSFVEQLQHTLSLLYGTVLLRPYVFIFLTVFLFAGITSMGRARTCVFLFGTWILAFLSEYSSTRNGFPYGWYHYTETTRDQELFISNVPFMDSLSYSFLLFASYSMSLYTLGSLRRRGWKLYVLDTFKLRRSVGVLFLTAVYMMMIDFIIDPVALQGEKWFLGKIYYYDYQGYYFGVPLSNALGWGIVGFVATFCYQRLEAKFFPSSFRDKGVRLFGLRSYFGIGLYYGVLVFNLAVTAWIESWGLLIAGCFIWLLPTILLAFKFIDPRAQATPEQWADYLSEWKIENKA